MLHRLKVVVALLVLLVPHARAGIEHVVDTRAQVVARARGYVVDAAQSRIAEAQVEVFDHPELLIRRARQGEKQNLVAAGLTDETGSFDFPNVPPGRYEVRFTKYGFNVLSLFVVVKRTAPESRRIVAQMTVAT
jgi:Carboxypeptidase regulatory-like domain